MAAAEAVFHLFVSSYVDFLGSAIDNALKEYKKALEAVASKLTVKAYKEMTEAYINLASIHSHSLRRLIF